MYNIYNKTLFAMYLQVSFEIYLGELFLEFGWWYIQIR